MIILGFKIFVVWCIQAFIAILTHLLRDFPVRIPNSIFDFYRLTFLPYVLYCIFFDEDKLL